MSGLSGWPFSSTESWEDGRNYGAYSLWFHILNIPVVLPAGSGASGGTVAGDMIYIGKLIYVNSRDRGFNM